MASVKSKPESRENQGLKGPTEPWKVQVDVYLEDDTTDPPTFRIESCLPSYEEKPGDNILVFHNNGRPGFQMIFHLHDRTDKGYRFPRQESDAVWSKIGDDCPLDEAK